MKNLMKTKALPLQVLLLGAAAAAVRGALYLTAVDERNLLIRSHPMCWVLWLISAAAAVLILASVRKKKGSNRYGDNFPSGMVSALGCWCLAAGIALTILSGNVLQRAGLVRLWLIAGVLATAGLGWAGYDRFRGRQPNFLTYGAACLFLALHMVSRYQPWSGNPQVPDWVFSLLGAVGLTLCAYHQSAFSADKGTRRAFLATSLLTVFVCCAALPHTEYWALYLCGGIWAFTGRCRITAVPEPEAAPETE